MISEEQYFSCYILLTDQIPLSDCFNWWDIKQYVYCNCLLTRLWRHKIRNQRYTNADLKFSLYVRVNIKTISWKFRILNPKNSPFIYSWSLYFSKKVGYFLTYSIVSVCLQTNISYISGAHNSKSKCCYNAKPSAYYFYVRTKISVDFQICISVPLTLYF